MNINILGGVAGAKKAEGIAVIIDVFRASNTIIALLGQGVNSILAVDTVEKAYALKKRHPDHLLFGERDSLPPKGFDYGNSPAEAATLELQGKEAIFTTSNGTQGIVNAHHADDILIGSFANAAAIAHYIRQKKPQTVSLVAMGSEEKKDEEDELCAGYIRDILQGMKPDFMPIKHALLQSTGADRLRSLHLDADLLFSLSLDTYDVVPYVSRREPFLLIKRALS